MTARPTMPAMAESPAVPLTVVTGFLGSGKTTLIARLLRRPELAGMAVIVNEFGEIGLDHTLIEHSEEDLVELSTGCICCVMRGDLAATVGRLLARREAGAAGFGRILLETTGLADPAPVIQAAIIDPLLRRAVTLDKLVVTVDALTGPQTLDRHEESRRQAALADLLLITKTDLAPGAAGPLSRRLRQLNPGAAIAHPVKGEIAPDRLFAPVPADTTRRPAALDTEPGHDHHHHHGHDHAAHAPHAHDDIGSVSLRFEAPVHAVALTLFLQALAETLGPDLLRIKGLVAVREHPHGPAVVHGVQHVFHPLEWREDWPDGDRASRLVLIGRGLRADWASALLAVLEAEVRDAMRP